MLSQYYDYKNQGRQSYDYKLKCIPCYHTNYDCNYGWWSILSQIMLTHHNSTTSIVEVAKL